MKELGGGLVEFWDRGEHRKDHEAFKQWQVDNGFGFVLNLREGKLNKFHKAGCPHVRNFSKLRPNASLTRTPKVCSNDGKFLLELAGRERVDFEHCWCREKSHDELWK